ncbi:hypothetical protein [Caballeronia sp. LZ032]|uniref:hypothetical protein n=1 Tax=Caballeronia sp. LZ032 TaxID=3038565 RepID=UPI00285A20B1|nr:hypothetical protein [Caballeronia sp. LZ032]MDR5883812.1 hypothetical protein [Caballeronia sp. LZ032]
MGNADRALASKLSPAPLSIKPARVRPGTPAHVTFAVENAGMYDVEVVSSAFEIKRTMIGSRHALPKAGWGYAVTNAIVPGTVLPAHSELWTSFEADRRTTFRGTVPIDPPPDTEPQYYFSGRLLYRRTRGELFETTVYRRLTYPDWVGSIIEPGDTHLNKSASVIFAAA